MSRTEFLTICVLLGAILTVLLINLVYQHYIWKDVCNMWRIILEDYYGRNKKLHMGDSSSGEHREGPRGVLDERGPSLPENLRDAGTRSPFVY